MKVEFQNRALKKWLKTYFISTTVQYGTVPNGNLLPG